MQPLVGLERERERSGGAGHQLCGSFGHCTHIHSHTSTSHKWVINVRLMLCATMSDTLRIRHSWPSISFFFFVSCLNQHNNYCKSILGWHCKSAQSNAKEPRVADRRGQSPSKSCLYFSFILLIILPMHRPRKQNENKNKKPLCICPLAVLKHTFPSSSGIINDTEHSTYFNMFITFRMHSLLLQL